jgi:hypothetical protein
LAFIHGDSVGRAVDCTLPVAGPEAELIGHSIRHPIRLCLAR